MVNECLRYMGCFMIGASVIMLGWDYVEKDPTIQAPLLLVIGLSLFFISFYLSGNPKKG